MSVLFPVPFLPMITLNLRKAIGSGWNAALKRSSLNSLSHLLERSAVSFTAPPSLGRSAATQGADLGRSVLAAAGPSASRVVGQRCLLTIFDPCAGYFVVMVPGPRTNHLTGLRRPRPQGPFGDWSCAMGGPQPGHLRRLLIATNGCQLLRISLTPLALLHPPMGHNRP